MPLFKRDGQKRALLIELNFFHGHTIYSQCLFLLEKGYRVTLVLSSRQLELAWLRSLNDRVEIVEVSRKWQKLGVFLRTVFNRYDLIVFNTLVSNGHVLFALLVPQQIRYVAHNLDENYGSSGLNRMLHRLLRWRAAGIYVLSSQVYEQNLPIVSKRLKQKLTYFHPSFFAELADCTTDFSEPAKVIFAVPGNINARRRNYDSLFVALQKIAASPLADRVLIKILGDFSLPEGRAFVLDAAERGFAGSVVQFQREKFLAFPQYAELLKTSHFILPLIDDTLIGVQVYRYFVHTTPSSFMLSRGFAVPIVCSSDAHYDDDLRPFVVPYPGSDLFEGIVSAVALVDSGAYARIRQQYRQHMDAEFTISQRNYLR